jgi:hypothetical protein
MENLKCLSLFLGTDWNAVRISADFPELFGSICDENFPTSHFLLKFKRKCHQVAKHSRQKKEKEGVLFHKFHLKKDIQRFLHFCHFLKRKASFRGKFHHIWGSFLSSFDSLSQTFCQCYENIVWDEIANKILAHIRKLNEIQK